MKRAKIYNYMLSCDPGNHGSGLAVWYALEQNFAAYKLVGSTGTGKNLDQIDAIAVLEKLLAGRDLTDERCILVIETWMVQRCRGAVESLAASQRMWISAVERVFGQKNVKVVRLNSQTWMSRAGVLKMKKTLGETKAVTAVLAAGLYPNVRMTEDEADAVVMGNWWLQAGGMEGQEDRNQEKRQKKAEKKAKIAGKACAETKRTDDEKYYRQMGLI